MWAAGSADCSSKSHFKAVIRSVPENPPPLSRVLFSFCLLPGLPSLPLLSPPALFSGDASGSW